MRLAVYKRVSTDRQDMQMQDHSLAAWLATRPPPTSIVYFEDHGKSGSNTNRPGFQALCKAIDNKEADAVLVYRLDRLSRRATDAIELLIGWIKRDIEFFAADQPVLNLGKDQPFRLSILAIFSELAQIERDTLISRVRAGMAAAKAKGKKFGPPSTMTKTHVEKAMALKASGKSYREIALGLSVSVSTAHRLVNDYALINN